jgi:uncharacterized repeat protein (TIGR02543 family)
MHKKRFIFAAIVATVFLLLAGCEQSIDDEPEGPTYTVTFHKNGGDTDASPRIKTGYHSGDPVGALPADPTRTGHGFNGWNTKADGSGTAFTTSTAVTANITVFAKWVDTIYTVTFDSTGGSAVSSITVVHGSTPVLPANPTSDDASKGFAGWYTEASGGGTPFTASTPVLANITVHAHWLPFHTVSFDPAGGSAVAPITVVHSVAVGTLPADPTKLDVTFSGWHTGANGGGTPFTASTAVTADMTVYAKWTVGVTFNSDGGSAVSPSSITGITPGATAATAGTLPANPGKTGLAFGGWYTAVNGGGTEFAAGTPVTANITVYARWTATVTFDSDEGSPVPPITGITSGDAVGTLPADPTKPPSGSFGGWYTAVNGAGTPFTASTPVTANITVYAKWKDLHVLLFDSEGGSAVGSIYLLDGDTLTPLPITTKLDVTFGGWYTDSEGGGTQLIDGTVITQSYHLYAKWMATVTFDTDGGSAVAPKSFISGRYFQDPIDPTKDHYRFSAWYTEPDCDDEDRFTPNDRVYADMTLYAKWINIQGDAEIALTFDDLGSGAFSQTNFTISRSVPLDFKTVLLTNTTSWTSVEWRVDNQVKGTTNAITVRAVDYAPGGHTLYVTVVKDGVPWTETLSFTVTN